MLLCDSVQVAEGKLFILGGGWSVTGPDPTPSGIAIKLDVEWSELDLPHHWELFLVDQDGKEIIVETPEGPQPIEMRGDFQIGRPTGVPEGIPISLPLAFNLGPLPLPPDGRYTWRLSMDGHANADWELAFTTRPASEGAPDTDQGMPGEEGLPPLA